MSASAPRTERPERKSVPAEGGRRAGAVPRPELRGLSIVLVGNFNPLIYRPDWLVSKGIVAQSDVDEAVASKQIELIHPEMVQYHLPWASIQVQTTRFAVQTSEDPLVRVHDLVLGAFAALPETPLTMMGINLHTHYPTTAEEEWHAIGDILAPKAPWAKLVNPDGKKRIGGLRSMIMEQKPRADGRPGHIQVKVEPSISVRFGIFVEVNDHYQIDDVTSPKNAAAMMTILRNEWEVSIARATELSDAVMELA
jgi:hypothetical protein